ncbi:formate dehydrogenase accessory sulfurtransferase FdhD [Alicyclobacillus sp.]|uniref:formate dehydrogenase accessory sulfurtransferase FdhD n=1 Tax=Alicyclobacillus sp. TaxID=61169 RepID=UPI0025C20C7B|nr:formate dehydrogenase accessory sulfurtransferase FdhD [Alicyclobacillus sp.]MCL6515828.1 formate dehydrogenase accessory sulfurtransferase FdhD [Alicyclobacillus sp.]
MGAHPASCGEPEWLPVRQPRSLVVYRDGRFERVDDVVASEYALTIFVGDQEMATVVCTPDHLEDLVVGFLASEGVIRRPDQLVDLTVVRARGIARVKTTTQVTFNQAFYNKRYIGSCCGKGRQMFYYYNDAQLVRRIDDPVRIRPDDVLARMAELEAGAHLWRETGGVHMASLCTPEGTVLARTDIGRHNALDKLYGHVLRNGLDVSGHLIAFSGRLSSEVLLKVAKIGVGMVIAKSAPTALALDIAQETGVTAIGFARRGGFHVYTHPWRVQGAADSSEGHEAPGHLAPGNLDVGQPLD